MTIVREGALSSPLLCQGPMISGCWTDVGRGSLSVSSSSNQSQMEPRSILSTLPSGYGSVSAKSLEVNARLDSAQTLDEQ